MQEFYTHRNCCRAYYFTHYWSKELYFNLKKEIKGTVYSEIVDDTLKVTIYGANGIVFRYTRENMQSEIVQGLSIEIVTEIIVKRYKKYILNLYFE